MGYKVNIEIECDEPNEICQHLSKIKSDLIKVIKQKNSGLDLDDRLIKVNFDDNNCYGDHTVKITIE